MALHSNHGQPAPIDAGHAADSLANSPIARRLSTLAAGHMRSGGGHPDVAFHHDQQARTPTPLGVTSTHNGNPTLQAIASSLAANGGSATVVRLDQANASGARNMSQFGARKPGTFSPGTGNTDEHHIAPSGAQPARARRGADSPTIYGPSSTKGLEQFTTENPTEHPTMRFSPAGPVPVSAPGAQFTTPHRENTRVTPVSRNTPRRSAPPAPAVKSVAPGHLFTSVNPGEL